MTPKTLLKLPLLSAALILLAAPLQAQLSGTDNFNDNSKDSAKWGADAFGGGAIVVEANARLEYRVATPDTIEGFDEALRPWILNTSPNASSFDVILDVFNNVNPSGENNASIGLVVTSLENAEDSIFVELYRAGPMADGKGFLAALSSQAAGGEVLPHTTPTAHGSVTTASVRLNYDPTTKIFTAYYDTTGSGDGFQWQAYGSFGVGAGGGGTVRNSPWQLTQSLGFKVSVGAFSEGQVVPSGAVYADNFFASPPQVNVLGVTKTRLFDQTAAGTVVAAVSGAFNMSGFIAGTEITGFFPSNNNRFVPPGKSATDLDFEFGDWYYESTGYATQAALDADFPNGSYSFQVGASPEISLALSGNSYPTVPVVTASAGTWSGGRLLITPQEAAAVFTLTSNVSNGDGFLTMELDTDTAILGLDEEIFFEVIEINTGAPVVGTVPPGALIIGYEYEVETEFDEVVDSTSIATQTWAHGAARAYALYSSRTLFQIQVLTAQEAWRLQNFGVITNSGSAADTSDQDLDGVPNLLEWAAGLNPSASSPLVTPVTRVGGNLEFTYPRSVAALNAGVTFIVEWSDTLAANSWSTVGVTQQVLSDNGTVQQVKATLPAGTNAKRFVRLRVTSPP